MMEKYFPNAHLPKLITNAKMRTVGVQVTFTIAIANIPYQVVTMFFPNH
jgi:hypothetical protein